jgi:hypothetical protein
MILRIEQPETGTLLLHMAIMRKSVRKGFKKNYGSNSIEVLRSYDEVKETLIRVLEVDNAAAWYDLHFNIKEVEMLHSFLDFYTKELQNTFDNAPKISKEDTQQIQALNNVKTKVNEMINAYA